MTLCLAYRAKKLKILTEYAYKKFIIKASQCGWRKNEPSRIEQEESDLFKQLVFRAIAEEEMNIQRGAELLNVTYKEITEELGEFNQEE